MYLHLKIQSVCVSLQSIPCVNLNTRTFLCWKKVLTYLVLNLYEY